MKGLVPYADSRPELARLCFGEKVCLVMKTPAWGRVMEPILEAMRGGTRTGLDGPRRQQHGNQPSNAIPIQRRRRPSPRRDWAGSTFVKMVERAVRCANPVIVQAQMLTLK
jgi:hypothetical protein